MDGNGSVLDADWLSACRRARAGLETMLAGAGSTAERAIETGSVGKGGDHTLVIDATAEAIVFDELERLAADGHRFTAISEERGTVDFGSEAFRVIVDPIDGSLNAKRGLPHHAVSIAVASGATMADVEFGYVYDFGPREEWWAWRNRGAWLGGTQLDVSAGERRGRDGRLEVLGIESADPRWVAGAIDDLVDVCYRLRALGTIASSLCQVAGARFDAMVSLRRCRAVDAAAAQLIVRESGGVVSFTGYGLDAPLDLEPRGAVLAARNAVTLAQLESLST